MPSLFHALYYSCFRWQVRLWKIVTEEEYSLAAAEQSKEPQLMERNAGVAKVESMVDYSWNDAGRAINPSTADRR